MAGIENWLLTEDPSAEYPPSPEPRETWPLPGGVAWVYQAPRHRVLTRPVVLADGFSLGRSNRDELYHRMQNLAFPFISELHNRDYDLVIVGYDERSAAIQDNAEAATAAISQAVTQRQGSADLIVGGFSMGGLVTRYALAKMEHDDLLHGEVGTYVSFDSPHRGAWIPISLQALAHIAESIAPKLREQVNSPAARQLLALHTETFVADPAQDPLRRQFLDDLRRYGGWPRQPIKLGIANGAGNGVGNGIPPGALTLSSETANLGLRLYAQDNTDDFVVAALRFLTQSFEKKTSGLARADSAPGGTLASFGIAAEYLKEIDPDVQCPYPDVNFVPSVSAVAVRDILTDTDLYTDISELSTDESELDRFMLSSTNTEHSAMTKEIANWFFEQIP
ncbi:esterase/lipase family protein [Spongiactinospora rosea]|nr:hypothetical protein [Spongiactinospora rosea]